MFLLVLSAVIQLMSFKRTFQVEYLSHEASYIHGCYCYHFPKHDVPLTKSQKCPPQNNFHINAIRAGVNPMK